MGRKIDAEVILPKRSSLLHTLLIAKEGGIVTHAEIRERLKIKNQATTNNVAQEVRRLRKGLGDSAPEIVARNGFGYKIRRPKQ